VLPKWRSQIVVGHGCSVFGDENPKNGSEGENTQQEAALGVEHPLIIAEENDLQTPRSESVQKSREWLDFGGVALLDFFQRHVAKVP
jgi:hypothetical protein